MTCSKDKLKWTKKGIRTEVSTLLTGGLIFQGFWIGTEEYK